MYVQYKSLYTKKRKWCTGSFLSDFCLIFSDFFRNIFFRGESTEMNQKHLMEMEAV